MLIFVEFKYLILMFLKDVFYFVRNIIFGIFSYLIPIKKNKIVIRSQKGNSIGGNVKYIVREIEKQNLNYELVWLCNKDFKEGREEFKNVRFVDNENKYRAFFETASAKLWLDDSVKIPELRFGLRKKRGQKYINTWHGSFGIKKLFYDVDEFFSLSLEYIKLHNRDFSKYCDIMLSNCSWEDEVFKRAFRFEGKIERVGHPKNDIFFEDREFYRKKVFNKLGIKLDKKVALYMPSFRESLTTRCFNLDYKRVENSLNERFGGDWVVVSRFHPFNLENKKDIFEVCNSQIDATYYSDPQELLVAADVLISDYSSCMFDYMMTKRPCFIFATDIAEYNQERGFYYPLETTPFPIAQNNDEMQNNILNFDVEKFKSDSEKFLTERNILEDGLASKRTVEIIKNIINV